MSEHLKSYEERNGQQHPMLAGAPALPVGCSSLWTAFLQLSNARHGPQGPSPISYRNMLDWQDFYGVKLAGWEVDAIGKADDAYFESRSK